MLELFQVLGQADRTARLENLDRLRKLAVVGEVDMVCAHDPVDFDRCCAAQTGAPRQG